MLDAFCSFHPARPGIAACVDCGRTVCPACATAVDDIHRCAVCLGVEAARAAPRQAPHPAGWSRRPLVAAAGWWGCVLALVWAWYALQLRL